MSAVAHDVLKYGLLALFFAAFGIGAWASSRMMKSANKSGHESFDARWTIAAFNSSELPIFVGSLLVGIASVVCIRALGLG